MNIKIGDTVTAVTPSGVLIRGQVTDKYETDAEGRPLTGGPTLVVSARDSHGQDREHVVKMKDVSSGRD